VAIVDRGSLVALDSPRALLDGLGQEILEFRVAGDPERTLAVLRHRGVAGADAFVVGSRITLALHRHSATDALAVLAGEQIRALELTTRAPSLDDVYLKFTGSLGAAA
jgi:ABC-2 type transport system ATP-binding protein